MKRGQPAKFHKLRYQLDNKQEQAVIDYLNSKIVLRELGERLGVSHQGAKNLLPKVIRDWISDGKYQLNRMFNHQDYESAKEDKVWEEADDQREDRKLDE